MVPEDWATPETVAAFDVATSIATSHRTGRTLAVFNDGGLALVAGPEGIADIYDLTERENVRTLQCGASITDGLWWNDKPVIANSGGAVQIFTGDTQIAEMRGHAGSANALALHSSGELLASVGVDKSYILYDLSSFKVVSQVYTDSGKQGRHSILLKPC